MNKEVTLCLTIDSMRSMNISKLTSHIMILLMLFQSFSAVASSLDFHVVDPQHMQHEHDHNEHVQNALSDFQADVGSIKNANTYSLDSHESGDEHHNPSDCHHCGHCNGTHAQWVGFQNLTNLQRLSQNHDFDYLDADIEEPTSRLLRPPKTQS